MTDVDSMKKKNILIVHNYYQIPGGEDTVVANEKKMLEECGHKVILYSRNNSELKKMSKLRKMCLLVTTIFNPKTYWDVKKLIRKEEIEIVHVHNTLNLVSPAVYYAAKSMKVPVVQTIHNFRLLCPAATFYRNGHVCEDCVDHGLNCAVKHRCYRNSRVQTLVCVLSTWFHRMMGIYGKINYICLTEFNKIKLLELKQVQSERVFVKPNFTENISNRVIPYEDRKNQFIFVGRLDSLKGIDFLLKAWKELNSRETRLVICGTGPMRQWCENFIAENGLSNVEYRDFVPNQQAIQMIAESKALILPTQWYEGFPMTIVEAYSVGTPVIGPDFGNAGNLILDGITGYRYRKNDAESLQEILKRCSCSAEDVYQYCQEHYSKQKNYETLNRIYEELT